MLDKYQEKQNIVYKVLKNAIVKNKISHAYLFETNGFPDAKDLAISFAKALLCPYNYTNHEKCVNCTQCQNIDKNCFLELKIISPEGLWIKKEQLDELQKEFSMKSVESDKKIYIIENADRLNASSANTILKFLEEPNDNIIAILIADNAYQVLETIVSRCQIVSFKKFQLFADESFSKKLQTLINIPDEIKEEEKLLEKIESIIQFVQYLETKELDCILFTQRLWHENISGKEMNLFAFDILTLYYKDMINKKIGRNNNVFEDKDMIDSIIEKNSLLDLNKKLKNIIDLKNQIQYNANAVLLVDRLIIELVGGVR